ncbi:hypothetical protein ACFY7C_36685 [Streptomyces sp. NPDC012769]|uniref:hypothetical protein n=1 Tax=Streptomyces sp. NPDC012769 TaxID=3364848 RepID=UPI003696C84F
MYISVDPGENVGVATFREDGTDIGKTVVPLPNFRTFLTNTYFAIKDRDEKLRFVVESFALRQDKSWEQTGSNMPASRCIGSIEQIMSLLGEQSMLWWAEPRNLRGALKIAGYPELARKPKNWHCPDDLAAYAHGVHRLVELGVRKHPIFDN